MSKSRGNVVNPDEFIEAYGADSLRLYEMFMGPLDQAKPWQTSGIQGMRRFVDRVYSVATGSLSDGDGDLETRKWVHRTIKKVTLDIEALRFNTAISAMMVLTNHLMTLKPPPRTAVEVLVRLISPFAPHLAEELWSALAHPPPIVDHEWPGYDEALTVDEVIELAVQVNGRVRGRIELPRDADSQRAQQLAVADPNVKKHMAGKTLKKFIYVPGRIANLIVG
jgi:leucyl-tRNA synthetase